jgi:acetyltransferase
MTPDDRRTSPPADEATLHAPSASTEADVDALRRRLLHALAAIAPESAIVPLDPQRPLRDQVELDSLDWVNLLAALPPGADGIDAADGSSPPGPRASLDEIVAWACGTPRGAGVADATADPRLRPLGAADAALEADFVRGLSSESRYMRFMGSMDELSAAKLAALTDVDQRRHVAIAAVVPAAASAQAEAGAPHDASADALAPAAERIVGVARYVVDDSTSGCEFAVTVADDWQRSGLAGRLMRALVDRARAAGLARLDGVVLSTNRPMLQLAHALGFTLKHDPDDPRTVRAQLDLEAR